MTWEWLYRSNTLGVTGYRRRSVAKEGNYCLTGVCISDEGWLTKLANFTGVPVMAAEHKQYVDENWTWARNCKDVLSPK
jgi:hypothetical protein